MGRSRDKLAAIALIATSAIFLSGCQHIVWMFARIASRVGHEYEVEGYSVAPYQLTAGPRAGAAKIDITPPPGYSTGGHGPPAALARGHWTRMWARAFYVSDGRGGQIALVSLQLFAVAGGLHDEVALRVADLGIRHEDILLSATHTHHGAAHYLTSKVYNQFGGFYEGFDEEMLRWIADRVALAIREAHQKALDGGHVTLSTFDSTVAQGWLKNRSPESFLTNHDAQTIMRSLNPTLTVPCEPHPRELADPSLQGSLHWDLEGCPRIRAIDHGIRLLRIERGSEIVGTLVFFAAHPTVLVPDAPFYSSDFTGFATRALELSSAGNAGPVVGFFNGAEGDITARRLRRDVRGVIDHGEWLRGEIETALAGSPRSLGDFRIEVDHHTMAAAGAQCGAHQLAAEPRFGAAGLGGAEGDPTILNELGWRRGVRDRARDGQGPKQPALDGQLVRSIRLTRPLAPPKTFPNTIPLTLARIGALTLATTPFEMNTSVGYAIRAKLREHYGDEIVLVGLTDEYANYTVSPDEYASQDYMAASTIWGPHQGAFLTCEFDAMAKGAPDPGARGRYWPGPKPKDELGPYFVGERRVVLDDGFDEVLLNAKRSPMRKLPKFIWNEPYAKEVSKFDLAERRRVSIEERTASGWRTRVTPGGWPDDDMAMNLVTLVAAAEEGRKDAEFGAIWLAEISECEATRACERIGSCSESVSCDLPARCGEKFPLAEPNLCETLDATYRFRVDFASGRGLTSICSEPFTVPRSSRDVLGGQQSAGNRLGACVP